MFNLSYTLLTSLLAMAVGIGIPVPDYRAKSYNLEQHIQPVLPVCKSNVMAMIKGDETYMERYLAANKTITLPEARRLYDVCLTYTVGFFNAADMLNQQRSIVQRTQRLVE